MKRLFHYTTKSRLEEILRDGLILPASDLVALKEQPVVWFSLHPHWDPTATKGIIASDGIRRSATFEEMVQLDPPCRIEVDPSATPLEWRLWSVRSGVAKKTAKGLRKVAERQGASVSDWRMSFEPIKPENWRAVEVFTDGEWKPVPPV